MLSSALLSVDLQPWYSPACFEIAPVRLVWSYCCFEENEGKQFYIRKVFHLTSLERFFSVVVPFSKIQPASSCGQVRTSKKYVFWQCAVFSFAYRNDLEILFSWNNNKEIFLFFWLEKDVKYSVWSVENTWSNSSAARDALGSEQIRIRRGRLPSVRSVRQSVSNLLSSFTSRCSVFAGKQLVALCAGLAAGVPGGWLGGSVLRREPCSVGCAGVAPTATSSARVGGQKWRLWQAED